MKHVQFCILTGNENEMSSDISDTHTNCKHLTIIYAGLEPGVSILGCFCKMCIHSENIGFLPVLSLLLFKVTLLQQRTVLLVT